MEKIELLEEKIESVTRLIYSLRGKNDDLLHQCESLRQENELLSSENKMVRKLMTELDQYREERKFIKTKCEKLLMQYEKMSIS